MIIFISFKKKILIKYNMIPVKIIYDSSSRYTPNSKRLSLCYHYSVNSNSFNLNVDIDF